MRGLHLKLALLCVVLVGHSAASASLAAYSETRSFREALDGRPMEEAISGPVDKDTSSYGDRTGAGEAAAKTAGQQQPQPQQQQQQQQAQSGGSMMLTIPANGNLGQMTNYGSHADQQQQVQQVQTKSGAGGELEREAGPIDSASDGQQQQVMEQRARQMMAPSSRAPNGRLQDQTAGDNSMQQQMSGGYGPSTKSGEAASFGEEKGARAQSTMEQKPNNYGATMDQQQVEQQQQTQPDYNQQDQQQQQQQMLAMNAKQRAMAAMLMSMTSPRLPTGTSAGQYGDKMAPNGKGSMGAQMMMSLANKAAYMSGQKQKQRYARQGAPQMMMGAGGSYMMNENNNNNNMMSMSNNYGNGASSQNGNSYGANGRPSMSSQSSSSSYGMSSRQRNAPAGGMRRGAGQTGAYGQGAASMEKKMSPAMVNAMLNAMMAKIEQEGQSNYESSSMGGSRSADYGSSGSPVGPMMSAMAGMTPAKRDQYKRLMMAAVMQQQQQQQQQDEQQLQQEQGYEQPEGQQQQPMAGRDYGEQMPVIPSGAKSAEVSAMSPQMGAYGRPQGSMMAATMSNLMKANNNNNNNNNSNRYDSRRPSMSNGAEYASNRPSQVRQQPAQMADSSDSTNYGLARGTEQSPSGGANYGPTDQQRMQPAMGVAPMSNSRRPMVMQSYGGAEGASKGNSMMPQQQIEQQEQQSGYPAEPMEQGQMRSSPPTKGAQQTTTTRPNYGPASMGSSKQSAPAGYSSGGSGTTKGQQHQQYDADDQQQQQENDYGAAPMGMAEPFAFDYKIDDDYGNTQYRKEESDKNGVVRGSYGFTDNSGIYRHVEYVADENGFRANIKSNEPGLSNEGAPKNQQSGAKNGANQSMDPGAGYGGASNSQLDPQMRPQMAYGGQKATAAIEAKDQQQQMIMSMMMNAAQMPIRQHQEQQLEQQQYPIQQQQQAQQQPQTQQQTGESGEAKKA